MSNFKEFLKWAEVEGYDVAHTYDTDRSKWLALNPMTADLWRAWQAARLQDQQRIAELEAAYKGLYDGTMLHAIRIAELLDGYLEIASVSDAQMSDGDFARAIAKRMLESDATTVQTKKTERKPLTDEAKAVIDAARAAMDDSEGNIKISSHLAASLSLCLDEYDRSIEAAHGIGDKA